MLELFLRGMAIGVLLTIATGLARMRPVGDAARACILLCLFAVAYACQSSAQIMAALGPAGILVLVASSGGAAYYWLFGIALFAPGRLGWEHAIPVAALTAVGMTGMFLAPQQRQGVEVVHNLLEFALIGHVLVAVWRGRADDLVDSRLALRIPFMIALALTCLVVDSFELAAAFHYSRPWMQLAQAALLVAISLAGAFIFIEGNAEIFVSPVARRGEAAGGGPDLVAGDRQLLDRLNQLIGEEAFWRRPSLGIAQTAGQIGAPEYRVRQLINRHLGYRNFSDFLNERRIGLAKRELRDPAKARVQISTIAFDLGYASLGPFNRAFRDATGMTPREWREAPATA